MIIIKTTTTLVFRLFYIWCFNIIKIYQLNPTLLIPNNCVYTVPCTGITEHARIHSVASQLDRSGGHAQFLHWHHAANGRTNWLVRGVLHCAYSTVVQADPTFARIANPYSHVQGVGERADTARVFPGAGHRCVCQSGLLCGKATGE